MTDLKEALAGLDAVLPGLPVRITAPHEIGQSLEDATETFLRQIQQFESSAVDRVDQAQQAMADLRQEAEQVETQLDGEVDALESLHTEVSQDLENRQKELTSAIDSARQAMDALQQHLVQAGSAAEAAKDRVAQVVTNLEQTIEASQLNLQDAVAAALREVELLDVAAKTARADVEQGVDAFGQLMTSLADQARQTLQQAATDLDRFQNTHDGALQAHASELQGGQDKLLSSLQTAIEQELKSRISGAAGEAADALRALADQARQAAKRAASSRGDLSSALDEVRNQEGSIVETILDAKQAVEIVGLVWGI
jgi:hypothetical protein